MEVNENGGCFTAAEDIDVGPNRWLEKGIETCE